jgi:hypothetical protein
MKPLSPRQSSKFTDLVSTRRATKMRTQSQARSRNPDKSIISIRDYDSELSKHQDSNIQSKLPMASTMTNMNMTSTLTNIYPSGASPYQPRKFETRKTLKYRKRR